MDHSDHPPLTGAIEKQIVVKNATALSGEQNAHVRGHVGLTHCSVLVSFPEHWEPPKLGLGHVHDLLKLCTPEPHVTEQADACLHSDQEPLTGKVPNYL